MNKKIQAGVIGLGIGNLHAQAYQALPQTNLLAVCSSSPARLEKRSAELGLHSSQLFRDYRDLLALPDLDVVSVALPNHLHAPVTIAALEAGKHVLCEKPLATSAKEAQRMVDAARAYGRTLMVCFNYRFRDDARWLKAAVEAGRMGRIYYARAGWIRNAGIPWFSSWFTDRQRSGGGPLIDLGVHILDLTLWLMGYPRAVTVSGATYAAFGPQGKKGGWGQKSAPGVFDVEDLAAGFVRFENGSTLQLETSWAAHTKPGRDDYFITLYGSQGGGELYVANYTDRDTLTLYTEEFGQPVTVRPSIVNRAGGHELAVAHFVDRVASGQPVEAAGEQGLALMKIIDGLYESAATGREVVLE